MSVYLYAVTKQRKLLTWKCRDRVEAKIVMSNIVRSDLLKNITTMDISYQVEQPWLKKHNMYDKSQFITYESNKSYYYPWIKKERRIYQ